MQTKDFFGLIILVVGSIWIIYSLFYWINLAWRYPDKLTKWAIANAERLPEWFPLKSFSLKNAKRRSFWPARLIMPFIDIIFVSFWIITFVLIEARK